MHENMIIITVTIKSQSALRTLIDNEDVIN